MDFWEHDDLAAHRTAARAWADQNLRPEWIDEQHRTGCHQTLAHHAVCARDGLLGAGWPAHHGGTDVDPAYAQAVFDECMRRGLRFDGWSTTSMVLHTIDQVGTEEQKREYIAAATRGELLVALGYSEPDSGSDVAAAKTTATRDGDEWVINGQKMFTSTAQVCSQVFVLARTNPDAAKHKGLSLFLVPTSAAGFEYQPIHTLGGQTSTATFYSDVRVPERALIGGVDQGWSVMTVALVYERGAANPGSSDPHHAPRVAAWAAAASRPDGTVAFDDPLVAERIGRMAVDEEVTRLMSQWMAWTIQKGELPGIEGSIRKLFFTEAAQRHHSDTLDILGVEGVLAPGAPGAPAGGELERLFRAAVVTTIYGGASEVLRDMIAERHLGLPRSRPRG